MKRASLVDVQRFINEHPFGRFQRLIFFMCFVIVLLDGFDTAAIGFIAPSLLTEWHLSKPDLAPVLSAALFGLAFGALVSGPLSDRVGRRSLMVGSVFLFGVACVVSAFSTNIGQLTVLRFMTGIGLGAAMANAVTMMDEFGRAAAIACAAAGACVVVADIGVVQGEDTVSAIRQQDGEAIFVATDVADEVQVETLVAATVDKFGRLDGALNNAGLAQTNVLLHDLTATQWRRIQSVNYDGVFFCMKHEIHAMLQTGGGAIVNPPNPASRCVGDPPWPSARGWYEFESLNG